MIDESSYYDRATSWAVDTQLRASRTVRAAWICAWIATAVALLEAVALAMLAPLKSVQTVVLLVDKQTGYVQAVDPALPRPLLADEALTNSYLAQYVVAREGFDRATVAIDYRKVALWSAGRARAAYLAGMPATNPGSPFRRLAPGTIVQADVKSVSLLSPGMALVRFDTTNMSQDGQRDRRQAWVAVIRFRYVEGPMRLADRFINPLGFQVTAYRRDQEAPPPADGSAATPASAVNPSRPIALEASRRVPPPIALAAFPPSVTLRPETQSRQDPGARTSPRLTREVPLSKLPLGSPLSPTSASSLQTASVPR